MGQLAIARMGASARELASRSRAWGTTGRADALLVVGVPTDEATVVGAFQRSSEVHEIDGAPIVRRGSGGGVARVGPGTVWLQLSLAREDALVPCTPDKLLNRYVRPLLRALTRVSSVPASYFGRDWISAAHRPVALVAFAHDGSTRRALFEALVAVRSPFADADRQTFLGKLPATLEDVSGRPLDPARVTDAIVEAYAGIASALADPEPADVEPASIATMAEAVSNEPPWSSTRAEAMGTIGAGRDATGRLRIGGELMASRDAIARLEDRVAALPAHATVDDVGRIVDEALTNHGALTFGVRTLASIRDVIVDAMKAP